VVLVQIARKLINHQQTYNIVLVTFCGGGKWSKYIPRENYQAAASL